LSIALSDMKYREAFGYQISRIGLGTVQLGLTYGIANKSGQPSTQQAQGILQEAKKSGITFLDTARGYGTSEEIIGEFLKADDRSGNMIVSTKLPGVETLKQSITETIETSRQMLGLARIPFLLLHRAVDLNEKVLSELKGLQAQSILDRLGVSIYTPEEAEIALAHKDVDIIQIPFNIFDQRLRRNGFLKRAAGLGKMVIARSAYLQGLALMEERDIPEKLSAFIPFKQKFKAISENYKIFEKELALRYVLSQNEITSVIVGAETVPQVKENIEIASRDSLPENILKEIESNFVDIPDKLINPALWN